MARVRHTLQALQARAQAVIALADNGPASLVQSLAGVLPPLAKSGNLLLPCSLLSRLCCTSRLLMCRFTPWLLMLSSGVKHKPMQHSVIAATQHCLDVSPS